MLTQVARHAVPLAAASTLAIGLVAVTPSPGDASQHCSPPSGDVDVEERRQRNGVAIELGTGQGQCSTDPTPATDDGLVWVSWPVMSFQDGEVCIGTTGRRVDPDDRQSVLYQEGWNFEMALIAYLQSGNPMPPTCPGADPVIDIFEEVRAIVREAMPAATPTLQPQSGWKAGMPVYLLLNRPNDHDPEPQTVNLAGFGPVTVTMSASVRSWVDWGDPHNPPAREEVTGRVGREWDPNLAHDANGSITHTYTHVGGYTITIEDVWTVQVDVGGLLSRTVEVTMDPVTINLEVGQAQAVVTG
jgi:hypothetical protein